MIKRCSNPKCEHEYQDKMYGPKMRVHTVRKSGEESCTVCQPGKITRKVSAITYSFNEAIKKGMKL